MNKAKTSHNLTDGEVTSLTDDLNNALEAIATLCNEKLIKCDKHCAGAREHLQALTDQLPEVDYDE